MYREGVSDMSLPTFRSHVLIVVLVLAWLSAPASASTIFNVNINTAGVVGLPGSLVFDLTIEAPPSPNHAEIVSFTAPGSTAGLPTTQGGLVEGDLVLPPFNTGAFTEIEGGSFFNELSVNFTSFGPSISF